MALDFFLNYILPPIIISLGLIGNTIGLMVISKKKLKKIGPVLIYKFLFITDTIYLSKYIFKFLLKLNFSIIFNFINEATIIFIYMPFAYNYDPTIISSVGCKLYNTF